MVSWKAVLTEISAFSAACASSNASWCSIRSSDSCAFAFTYCNSCLQSQEWLRSQVTSSCFSISISCWHKACYSMLALSTHLMSLDFILLQFPFNSLKLLPICLCLSLSLGSSSSQVLCLGYLFVPDELTRFNLTLSIPQRSSSRTLQRINRPWALRSEAPSVPSPPLVP